MAKTGSDYVVDFRSGYGGANGMPTEFKLKNTIMRKVQNHEFRKESMIENPEFIFANDGENSVENFLLREKVPFLILSIYGGQNQLPLKEANQLYSLLSKDLFKSFASWAVWFITDGISQGVSQIINQAVYDVFAQKKTELEFTDLSVIGITPTNVAESAQPLLSNHDYYILYNFEQANFRLDLQRRMIRKYTDKDYSVILHLFITGDSRNLFYLRDVLNDENISSHISIVKGICKTLDFICECSYERKITYNAQSVRTVLPGLIGEDLQCVVDICNHPKLKKIRRHILNIKQTDKNLNQVVQKCIDTDDFDSLKIRKLKGRIKTNSKSEIEAYLNQDDADLENAMLFALRSDRADVVEMILENKRFHLHSWLTRERLSDLFTRQKMIFKFKSLEHVAQEIRGMTYNQIKCHFNDFDPNSNLERHLFLWALLRGHFELIDLLWHRCGDPISSAIVTAWLMRALSPKAFTSDLAKKLMDNAMKYEKAAMNLMAETYAKNQALAEKLFYRKVDFWNKQSILTLATLFDMKIFLCHPICIEILNPVWHGKVPVTTGWITMVFYIFFGLIFAPFALIEEDEIDYYSDENDPNRNQDMKKSLDDEDIPEREDFKYSKQIVRKRKQSLNYFKSVHCLYTSPMTKFYMDLLSFIMFLFIMTYFVCCKMHAFVTIDDINWSEWLTWFWCLTFFFHEIDQFAKSKLTAGAYWGCIWFIFEIVLAILLILAIVLRLTLRDYRYEGAQICYIILLAFFFLRLFKYFFTHPAMGPKAYTLFMMLDDLAFFEFVVVVLVFSYGVVRQAILFPEAELSGRTFLNLLYYPVWQAFGQVGLIEGVQSPLCLNPQNYLCQNSSWLLYLSYVIFLLAVHTLLLNYLIILYGNTLKNVMKVLNEIYYYQDFNLLWQYHNSWILPPPFTIVLPIVWIFKCFYKCKLDSPFNRNYKSSKNLFLKFFEEECCRSVKSSEQAALELPSIEANMNEKFEKMNATLREVMAQLEQLKQKPEIKVSSKF